MSELAAENHRAVAQARRTGDCEVCGRSIPRAAESDREELDANEASELGEKARLLREHRQGGGPRAAPDSGG
eukprot:3698460-Alexandrium_andersonii.AAC.1